MDNIKLIFNNADENSFITAEQALYITKHGIYAEHECQLVGSNLITSDWIETQYSKFSSLKDFMTIVRNNSVRSVEDERTWSEGDIAVGWVNYIYNTTAYDQPMEIVSAIGEWMDDVLTIKYQDILYFIEYPHQWK